MNASWDNAFSHWATPPSQTEINKAKNAVSAVRNAVSKSLALQTMGVRVFEQGSYRNRVNVRSDSDVDVGVICKNTFFDDYPTGAGRANYGNVKSEYSFGQFKNDLGFALRDHFGVHSVLRGNKAFQVNENTYRIDADVVPLFEYRRYWGLGRHEYSAGTALLTDRGERIVNYPERLFDDWPNRWLHYENGVEKNRITGRSYKGVVRILKCILNQMKEQKVREALEIPGYLCECMVYMCPNNCFSASTWSGRVYDVLSFIYHQTSEEWRCRDWTEVDEIKYLFHSSQKWDQAQAHAFIGALGRYLGVQF